MTPAKRLALVALALPALAVAQATPRVVTLDEAVRSARAHQPQLRRSRAGAEAAAARASQARAPLLPQLNGTASYERATSNFVARPGAVPSTLAGTEDGDWSTSPYFSAGVTLSQTLLDLGELGRARSAGAAALAERASARASELDVVTAARTSYFAARAARDLVGVQRETLGNQEAHLRQVQAFVEVGTRPAIDLAQARADRANAQVGLLQAENRYATARAQLAQAMGLDGTEELEIADDALPPVDGEEGALDPLVAEALAARPELASLAEQRRAQALARDAARAGYLPTVSAQTGLSDAGRALDETAWNWSASVTLGWNLFSGGATRARVREADANLEALAAEDEALRTSVRLEVHEARLTVRASRAALDAAAEALAAAAERLRLAEGRYRAGAGSIIELGDAQVAATAAGAQRVQAEYDLASARARLLRALGRS